MTTSTYICGSCAAAGIHDLGLCGNAENAMVEFCKRELIPGVNSFSPYRPGVYTTVAAFYIFVAGPEEPGHGHSKPWVKYGTEFADYIASQQLGGITTLPAKLNSKYHPNTTCQVWLWSPDQQALQTWWENLIKRHPDLKPVAPPPPPPQPRPRW